MNVRQLRLKNMIDSGNVPMIIDATSIGSKGDVPFHWGDIEEIGYGRTKRIFDKRGEKVSVDRYYTGPGMIYLSSFGEMKAGDVCVGEK